MDMLSYIMGSRSGGGGGSVEYPGYDLVISLDNDDSSALPMVEKGNYADAVAKIQQNKFVSAAFYGYNGYNTIFSFPYSMNYDSERNRVIINCYDFLDQMTFNILLQSDNTVIWGD